MFHSSSSVAGAVRISNFREVVSTGTVESERAMATEIGATEDVTFIVDDGSSESASILTTLRDKIQSENTDSQICAYYLSALQLFMPSLHNEIRDIFTGFGWTPYIVRPQNVRMLPAKNKRQCALILGQLILVLYKKAVNNYNNYMRRTIIEMKAPVGPPQLTETSEIAVDFRRARVISQVLVNCFKLKKNSIGVHTGNQKMRIYDGSSLQSPIIFGVNL